MITHILKNGTVLHDITGHVVKKEENPLVYEILDRSQTLCEVAGVEKETKHAKRI